MCFGHCGEEESIEVFENVMRLRERGLYIDPLVKNDALVALVLSAQNYGNFRLFLLNFGFQSLN